MLFQLRTVAFAAERKSFREVRLQRDRLIKIPDGRFPFMHLAVNNSAGQISFCVVRPQGHGVIEIMQRLFIMTQMKTGIAASDVKLGRLRLNSDGLVKILNGRLVLLEDKSLDGPAFMIGVSIVRG